MNSILKYIHTYMYDIDHIYDHILYKSYPQTTSNRYMLKHFLNLSGKFPDKLSCPRRQA